MNGEENFFRFMNYLQSNNPYTYINPYYSNSYNNTFPSFDQMTNMFMAMNQRYNELDREIVRIHERLEDFSYNNNKNNNYSNNSYGKRKRMNERHYNDGNCDNYDNYNNYDNYDNYDNYGHGRNYDYDYDDRYRDNYERHNHRSHSNSNNRHRRNRYNNRNNRNRYDNDDVDSYSKERDYNNYNRRKRQRVHNSNTKYNDNEEEDWDDHSDVEKYSKNKDKGKKKNRVYFRFNNEQDNYKKNIKNKKDEDNDTTENDSESSNESDSTIDNEEISIKKRSIGDNDTNKNKTLSKHSNNNNNNNGDNDNDDDNDDNDNDNNNNNNNTNSYNNRRNRNRRRNKNFVNDYSNFQPRFYYSKIKKEPKKKYLIVLDIYNLFYQRVNIDSVSSLIKVNPHYKVKNAFIYLRPFVDTFLKELFNLHKKFNNNEIDINNNNNDDEIDNNNDEDRKKEKNLETGFEVAIWNTAKPRMVKEIVQLILNNAPVDYLGEKKVNYMKKLHFIWTLDQCQSNENMIDDEAPRNLRLVDTIINSKEMDSEKGTTYPPVNEFGHWKKENIILVSSLNPKYFPKKSNYLCVPPYDVNNLQMEANNDTSLLSLLQYLENLLNAKPTSVIDHLNSNPFSVQKKDSFGIIKSLKNNLIDKWDTMDYPNRIRQTEFYITQNIIEERNRKSGIIRKKSNVIYKNIPHEPKNKYLIIFDLNGTLLHRLKNNNIVDDESTRKADFSINGKFVFLRPYIDAFIETLFDIDGEHKDRLESGFAIGTWTSAMLKNSELMLNQILQVDVKDEKGQLTLMDYSNRIFFKWARDFCTPIPETDHETEKNMDNLWNHKKSTFCKGTVYPAVNEFNHWNEKNTIIIDDSPHKAKQYPYNAIHIPTFEITNEDSDSETVLLSLIKYLKKLYKSGTDNVQEYIKKHPFSEISYDTSIEEDDSLSKQEKFDKIKESIKIKVKSKWVIKDEEKIEKYAAGHSKYRVSRLQLDLFNSFRYHDQFPSLSTLKKNNVQKSLQFESNRNKTKNESKSHDHSHKSSSNTNDKTATFTDTKQQQNRQQRMNIDDNNDDDKVKDNSNNTNNNDNNNNDNNSSDNEEDDDRTIYDKNNENLQLIEDENNNDSDDTNDDDNRTQDEIMNEEEKEEGKNDNDEEKINKEFEGIFKDGHLKVDEETERMIEEIQDFTNNVSSGKITKPSSALFKRGVFF